MSRTALGLPAPERTVRYDEPEPSPVLSQLGDTWPADGRLVGIVVTNRGEAPPARPIASPGTSVPPLTPP